MVKKQKWLSKVLVLLENNKVKKVSKNKIMGYGVINIGKDHDIIIDRLYGLSNAKKVENGFLIHEKCYKLSKGISYDLLDNRIPSLEKGKSGSKQKNHLPSGYLRGINYKGIQKYALQSFRYHEIIIDNNIDLIMDPSKNPENKKRILNILNQIESSKKSKKRTSSKKSKKRKISRSRSKSLSSRPSPNKSATDFSEGIKRKGNDGNMWVVKKTSTGTKRWNKIS